MSEKNATQVNETYHAVSNATIYEQDSQCKCINAYPVDIAVPTIPAVPFGPCNELNKFCDKVRF